MSVKIDDPELDALRTLVEEKIGMKMTLPRYFALLSSSLIQELREYLSSTTLQRVWAYKTGYGRVSAHTLNVLCHYVGYPDWEGYCQSRKDVSNSESDMFVNNGIDVSTLKVGTCVRIAWNPDRECVIRYLGNYYFEAIETRNAKLCKGDRFTCLYMQKGREMVVSGLERHSEDMNYVIANKNGLTTLEILQEE